MLLYHGSLVIIKEPDLSFSKGRRDFGKGFYLTSSLEQAVKWAKRNMRINNLDKGYVSIYEFDEKALIKTKVFSKEDFVMIRKLMSEKLHDQYLFRTQKALSYLKYTNYMEVSND